MNAVFESHVMYSTWRRLKGCRQLWRGLALAGFFVGTASLCVSPAFGQAETILVSNLNRASATKDEIYGNPYLQSFTTGDHAAGYKLTSIEMAVTLVKGRTLSAFIATSDSNGQPKEKVYSLTLPSDLSAETLTFTAPENATLEANTTYWVVIEPKSKGDTLRFRYTHSDDEDDDSAAGWSLGDKALHLYLHGAHILLEWSDGRALLVAVKGTTIVSTGGNTAATGRPSISGTPSVGQTLSVSTGDIADIDGTSKAEDGEAGYAYSYQWVRVDGGAEADIPGATSGTYTLGEDDDGKQVKVEVSFKDDADNAEAVTSEAWPPEGAVGSAAVAPLTAEFQDVPPEHDGSNAFDLRVVFSEDLVSAEGGPGTGGRARIMGSLTVVGGNLEGVRNTSSPARDDYTISVTPSGDGEVTLTLAAPADCADADAVCAPGGGALSAAASVTVRGPPDTPLTAGFEDVPAEHDGSNVFELRVVFSEELVSAEGGPGTGGRARIMRSLTVVGGSLGNVWNTARPARDDYTMSVTPSGDGEVTLTLAAPSDCADADAVCAPGGRALSRAVSATVRGPPGLSVADATVDEAAGAELAFAVTLDRAPSGTVTVDYATSDGTATAGEDYTAASGTLSFAAGETLKTVSVSVLDDSHDDDGETLTLRLSNPSGAHLADGEALGTIRNTDPMPRAWLARFGRAASDHAIQAVGARFAQADAAAPEPHLTIGGLRVDALLDWDSRGAPGGVDADHGIGAHARAGPWTGPEGHWARMEPRRAGTRGPPEPPPGTRPSVHGPAGGAPGQAGLALARGLAGLTRAAGPSRSGNPLMGSSFLYSRPLGGESGGWLDNWSAWGQSAATRFSGADGPLSVHGEVSTATVGFDVRRDRWMAGAALALSEGGGGYAAERGAGGTVRSRLTSLHPFARYRVGERSSVWGMLGHGVGRLSLTPEGGDTTIETDLATSMAAVGGRGVLGARAAGAGVLEVALRSDARFTRAESGSAGNLAGAVGDTARARLVLEGRGSFPLAGGAELRPTLEAGLRYDGGDAETGAGVEVGGGLEYSVGRLTARVSARVLAAHADESYGEWGYGGALSYQPGADGRGPRLSLGSSRGAARGGVEALWNGRGASGAVPGAAPGAAQRYRMEFGYGLAGARGVGLWVPYLGAEAGEGGDRALRMGLRFSSDARTEAALELGQRVPADRDPEVAIRLTGAVRW